MTALHSGTRGRVAEGLRDAAPGTVELRAGVWSGVLFEHCFEAHLRGEWLLLRAPIPSSRVGSGAENILRRAAELPGGVKIARVAGQQGTSLQWDGLLENGDDLAARARSACAAFEAALRALGLHGGVTTPGAIVACPPELRAALADGGWASDERPDGTLVVDLDVARVFRQAKVAVGSAETHVAVELSGSDRAAQACRSAAAALLLEVAAAVRMVRPVLGPAAGAARFEVVLSQPAGAAGVAHALGALRVACELAAREVELLLSDERIATLFLARLDAPQSPERTETEATAPPAAGASNETRRS